MCILMHMCTKYVYTNEDMYLFVYGALYVYHSGIIAPRYAESISGVSCFLRR